MKMGMLMDPIVSINVQKDSSFAMLLEAQRRRWDLYYLESSDIWLQDGLTWGSMCPIHVQDNLTQWFQLDDAVVQPLAELDVLFMRKDPPFTIDYIYMTYLLEHAEAAGLCVINKPASLRDANEK